MSDPIREQALKLLDDLIPHDPTPQEIGFAEHALRKARADATREALEAAARVTGYSYLRDIDVPRALAAHDPLDPVNTSA